MMWNIVTETCACNLKLCVARRVLVKELGLINKYVFLDQLGNQGGLASELEDLIMTYTSSSVPVAEAYLIIYKRHRIGSKFKVIFQLGRLCNITADVEA